MFSLSDVQRSGHVYKVAADVTIIYNSPARQGFTLDVKRQSSQLEDNESRQSEKSI